MRTLVFLSLIFLTLLTNAQLQDPFSNVFDYFNKIKLVGITSKNNTPCFASLSIDDVVVIGALGDIVAEQWQILELTHRDILVIHMQTKRQLRFPLIDQPEEALHA